MCNPNQNPQTPKNLRIHVQQGYPCAPRLSKIQKQPTMIPSQSSHNLPQKFHSAYQTNSSNPQKLPNKSPTKCYRQPTTSQVPLKTILTAGICKSTKSLSPNPANLSLTGQDPHKSMRQTTSPSYYFAPNKTLENLRPTMTQAMHHTPTQLKYTRSLSPGPQLQMLANESCKADSHFIIKTDTSGTSQPTYN